MSLFQHLDQFDQKIFLFLNGLHSPFMDNIMWYISGKILWIPLYLIIIYYVIRKRKWNVWVTLIAIAIMITLSDQLSDLIKDTTQRLRPTHNPLIAHLVHVVKEPNGNEYRGGTYCFISSHAANTFAAAVFVSMFFARRWLTISIFIWATVVSCSRIYLGVHYPFDILCGAILGFLIGMMIFYAERFVQQKYFLNKKQ